VKSKGRFKKTGKTLLNKKRKKKENKDKKTNKKKKNKKQGGQSGCWEDKGQDSKGRTLRSGTVKDERK